MNYATQFSAAFSERLDYAKKLLAECVKRQFCPYCCLRFLNWQNISLCAQPIETIIEAISQIHGEKYTFDSA